MPLPAKLQDPLTDLSFKTEEELFHALVKRLATLTSASTCLLSEQRPDHPGVVYTLAVWHDDRFLDNFEYPLENTPCQGVLRGQPRWIGSGLQNHFPAPAHPRLAGADSYFAVPLESTRGEILGHLAVFSTAPFADDIPAPLVLQLVAARASAELERQRTEYRLAEQRQRAEGRLRSIVEGTSTSVGEDFFHSLVQHLAKALNVSFAFVGQVIPPELERIRVLAVWAGTDFGESFEYALEGAPCEKVVGRSMCYYPRDVRELFPRDTLLTDMGVESYLGTPLFASSGEPLGLLSVMDDESMERDLEAEHLLRIFANRASTELERLRDERERRELEAEMRQAQKLESLGTLAGNVAHDFNNLLVGILGNAELAKKYLPESSRGLDRLRSVETAARRAAELASQMLTYSGKIRLQVEPCDLNQIIREITQLVEAAISKKSRLHFRFEESLPAIEADATQIRQVAMNLILNASEALGGESGDITIRTGVSSGDTARRQAAMLTAEKPRTKYVVLEIADSGCGMDEETRSRLFEPFFTTKPQGRGLGMAAILGILRSHQGGIDVDSKPGEGATFRAFLPASARPLPIDTDQEEKPEPASDESRGIVLVVDDEEMVRALAATALRRHGFEVITAEDGQHAIDVFEQRREEIDAVLLDMNMPHLSGEQVLSVLRDLRPDVPILLSSGYSQTTAARRFEQGDKAVFIKKPYRPTDLAQAVRQLIQS